MSRQQRMIGSSKYANEETERWDLIPMVMVNGELYLDTGHKSSKIE